MKQVAILVSMVFALVVFSPTLAPAFKDWVGQKPDQNGLLKPKKPPKGKSETNPKPGGSISQPRVGHYLQIGPQNNP